MKTVRLFIILFVISLLGCAVLGYQLWAQSKAHTAEMERLTLTHTVELEKLKEENISQLEAQTRRHEEKVAALTDDFEKRIDDIRGEQREKLTAAYQEFENIFEGNRQTIEYINVLEGKVRAGQDLSKAEVEKLAVIATGVGHLQKQYQKPLQEFQELQAYFERQAGQEPATATPKKSFGFFRRMFSKDYREAEKEFYREQGAQRAFEEAQGEFSRVYSSAQQAMRAVDLDAEKQVQKLYALIEDKELVNAQDLGDFFDKAREALKTHQDVLQFEPKGDLPQVPAP